MLRKRQFLLGGHKCHPRPVWPRLYLFTFGDLCHRMCDSMASDLCCRGRSLTSAPSGEAPATAKCSKQDKTAFEPPTPFLWPGLRKQSVQFGKEGSWRRLSGTVAMSNVCPGRPWQGSASPSG